MREKNVCRFCDSLGFYGKKFGGRRPFAISGASLHYAPDLPFKLEHILLDVRVDPKSKILEGIAVQRVRTIAAHQKILKVDQVGLQIDSIEIEGSQVEFRVSENSLHIDLAHSPSPGEVFEFSIRYRIENPRRGIYFTGPDLAYPHKPWQVWTQGQDEESRYWFPTLDYPNQKATSEMIATVPKGFTAVSNGALISRVEHQDGIQFHYKLEIPHVNYLITLVVGEFSEWMDYGPRNLPVQYFVASGREEDGKRAFGNTAKMIDAFEKKMGVPYPYEKYSQVAVQDFIFGGMENTSATTQTDLTLHDARAHLDFSSDPLVSHELAHQWFGDLLTCRDWSHGWLNEGFATFMERVWIEADSGPHGGIEEANYYSYQDLKEYLWEDQNRYRRPIVCNTYIEPIDLFDTHLYQKGGLVLNLIRNLLGEEPFWKSIQCYLNLHRGKSVETLDLIRAIEEVTGRNLRRFFDEWIFNAGYPEFEVSYIWHEEKKLTEWIIEQKQTFGQPSWIKDGVTTFLFHLPVILEITLKNGQKLNYSLELGEARERVFFPAPSQPAMVRFDPHHSIPKVLLFPRPKEMLLYQLKYDLEGMGRIEAAQELAKIGDREIVQALGEAVRNDPFWGVQVEICKVLAEIRTDQSRDILLELVEISHPKIRRAVVTALGNFPDSLDSKVSSTLKKIAEEDKSYSVEAEATYSWVISQVKPEIFQKKLEISEIEKFLLLQLRKSSYRDVIQAASLNSLAELPGIEKGERPSAFQVLLNWTQKGGSLDSRIAALKALGKILKKASPSEKEKILILFSELSFEESFRLRSQLVLVLEESSCPEAVSILQRIQSLELDGRVKRASRNAVDTLLTPNFLPESVSHLKNMLDKMEENYWKLRTKVEENGLLR